MSYTKADERKKNIKPSGKGFAPGGGKEKWYLFHQGLCLGGEENKRHGTTFRQGLCPRGLCPGGRKTEDNGTTFRQGLCHGGRKRGGKRVKNSSSEALKNRMEEKWKTSSQGLCPGGEKNRREEKWKTIRQGLSASAGRKEKWNKLGRKKKNEQLKDELH